MRRRRRIPRQAVGLLAAVVILAACWVVFGGPTPFAGSPYRVKALFTVQTQLHLDSPVRIAGVDVGKVTRIKRVGGASPAAVVTMTVGKSGLPIHANATATIRPRLFLEGNFYVALEPGSPDAPVLSSGSTLSAAHTSGPVQLDRVLSALNANARGDLQTLVQGFGEALNGQPSPVADADAAPSERGLTAAQSLNRSLDDSAAAFRASAIVNEALLGERPHDLSDAVGGLSRTFTALSASGDHLSGLVSSLNTTMGALAARQGDLSATLALLPGTLRALDAALGPLDASYGPTRTFARELLPGVRELGPTIDAGLPFLAQSRGLLSRTDLGGLLDALTPAVQNTGATIAPLRRLLAGSRELAACFNTSIIPTGNQRISDPPLTTGLRVYQELFQSAVGIASAAGDFDGNGRYLRSTSGGGADRVATPPVSGGGGPSYADAVDPPLGTRPSYPGKEPPFDRSVSCLKSRPPDLNSARTGAGP